MYVKSRSQHIVDPGRELQVATVAEGLGVSGTYLDIKSQRSRVQIPAQGDSAYSLLCVRTSRCNSSPSPQGDSAYSLSLLSGRVLSFEARGPGFKYQPREIQPTLYFVLGPPDLLCVRTSICNSSPCPRRFKDSSLQMVEFL